MNKIANTAILEIFTETAFLDREYFQKNGFLRKLHHENRGAFSLIFGVFHND